MRTKKHVQTGGRRKRLEAGIVTGALWLAASGSAVAQVQTLPDGQCMQDRAGFGLNCTANDVSVAGVARLPNSNAYDITITDPCQHVDDSVTFTARFDVVLTAQERHDIGIYFANDGDPNSDGALTGRCSVTTLEWRPAEGGVDLDGFNDPLPGTKKPSGLQDACGDINAAASPLKPLISITAACTDDDEDGFLDLPNCVSWRQSGANELCRGPADTFPGAPSKCKCDAGFDVPVPVPAEVALAKTVKRATDPDTAYGETARLDEPGGLVDYKVVVSVLGNSRTPSVTLNSLTDDIYGNIASVHGDITSTTCSLPQTLAGNGGSYACTFRVNVTGTAGNPAPDKSKEIVDTVTASAVDTVGNVFTPFDTAKVIIDDVKPSAGLDKEARTKTCLEDALPCSITYDVTVTNNSVSSDPITITALSDIPYGDITYVHDDVTATSCSVSQKIAGDRGTYSCWFTASITSGNAGEIKSDEVTATGADDEGNEVNPTDGAVVTILDVPASISLTKTAGVDSVKEPGDGVTYKLVLTNESSADSFTLNSLVDDRFGDVTEVHDLVSATTCVLPKVLLPGGSYSCNFTAYVAGNAGESHTNIARADGTDDDGAPQTATATDTVNVDNVPPSALLSKTVTSMKVTYEVVVTSDSEAEPLTLSALVDDRFGDITYEHDAVTSTTCRVPQVLATSGSYTCSFTAIVSTSPHVNIVTGTVDDDEGDDDTVYPSDSAEVTFGDPAPAP